MKQKHSYIFIIIIMFLSVLTLNAIQNRGLGFVSLSGKIHCYGRIYVESSHPPKALSPIEQNDLAVNHFVCTNKSFFATRYKEKSIPTVIYVRRTDGLYQAFSLSGSN